MASDSSSLDILKRAREARQQNRQNQAKLSACLEQLNELSAKADTHENIDQNGREVPVAMPRVSLDSDGGSYASDEEVPLAPLIPYLDDDTHHPPSSVPPLDRPNSHLFTASSLKRDIPPIKETLAPEPAPRLGWRMFGVGPAAEHSYQVDTHPSEPSPPPSSPLIISGSELLLAQSPPAPPSQGPSPFQFGLPLSSPSLPSPPGAASASASASASPVPSFLQLPPPRNNSASSMSPAEALVSLLSNNSKSLSPSHSPKPTAKAAEDPSLALIPSEHLDVSQRNKEKYPDPVSVPQVDINLVSSYDVGLASDPLHQRGVENLYPLSPVSKEHYMMSNPLFTSSNRDSSSSEGMLKKIVDRIEQQNSNALSPSSAIALIQVPSRPYQSYQDIAESSYDEHSFESVGEEDDNTHLLLPSPSRDSRGQRRQRPVTGGGGASLGGAASPAIKQQKLKDRRSTIERAVQADLTLSPNLSILSSTPLTAPAPAPAPSRPPAGPTQASFYGPGPTAQDFFLRSSAIKSEGCGSVEAPKKLASDFFRGVSPSTAPPPPMSNTTSSNLLIPVAVKHPSPPLPVPLTTLSPLQKVKAQSPVLKSQEDEVDSPPSWSPPRKSKGPSASLLEPSSFTGALEEAEGGEDGLSQAWNSLIKGEGEGEMPEAFKALLDQLTSKQQQAAVMPPPVVKEKTKAELLASLSPAMLSLGVALEAVLRPRVLSAQKKRMGEADMKREVFRSWRMMLPYGRNEARDAVLVNEEVAVKAPLEPEAAPLPPNPPPPGSLLSSLLASGLLSPNETDFSSDLAVDAIKRKGSARKRGSLMLSSILMGSPVPRPTSTLLASSSILSTNIKPSRKIEVPKNASPLDYSFYGLGPSINV